MDKREDINIALRVSKDYVRSSSYFSFRDNSDQVIGAEQSFLMNKPNQSRNQNLNYYMPKPMRSS